MGKLAKIKTTSTDNSVTDFVNVIAEEQKRADAYALIKLMEDASKEKPKMWGSSIIGFGAMRYKSPATGREVDWFKIGFSPRKANLSLYLNISLQQHDDTLQQLGKFKTGAGCVYIKSLTDIDVRVLKKLLTTSMKEKP